MTARTSPHTRAEVIRLLTAGHRYTVIADATGVSVGTVANIARDEGYGGPRNTRPDAEILRLLEGGLSYVEIAKRLGISTSSVTAAKRAHGIETATRRSWDDDLLIRLYAEGVTLSRIATALGRSESAVGARVARLGYTREIARAKVHGIPARWQEGCRCIECEPARVAYRQAERTAAKAAGAVTHGLAGYGRGCKCSICESAMIESLRARQDRTRKTAIAHREPWSEAEDDAVRDTSRRIEDIARDLGRTYSAVDNRRRLLARRARVHDPRS